MDQKELLKRYINRILELQDKAQIHQDISPEDLREVARELGLDEEDWEMIQKEIADHKARGRGFLRYQNYSDAIAEFEQALILNPIDHETLEQIAQAHLSRSEKEDYPQAQAYARRLLDLNPSHEPSLKLISTARQKESKQPSSGLRWGNRSWFVLLPLILVLLGVCYLRSSGEKEDTMETSQPKAKIKPPQSPEKPKSEIDLGIPIEFEEAEEERNFKAIPLSSSVSKYKEAFSYKAYGYLEVGNIEVEDLKIRVLLLDEAGNRIAEKKVDIKSGHTGVARPGDLIPWNILIYKKEELTKELSSLRWAIQEIKQHPGQDSYPPSPVIEEVGWKPSKPEGHELVFRERKLSLREPGNFAQGYVNIELEVENKGLASYRSLKIALKWKGGQASQSSDLYVFTADFPFLTPGRKAICGGTFGLDKALAENFSGYEIEIIEWS